MKTAKKLLAILMTTAMLFGCISMPSYAANPKKIDIAFVIDTTYSMYEDISIVNARMKDYLDDLEASGNDYRIAIVDYRDFSSRAGYYDYPYKVQLDFSSDYDKIIEAIDGLTLGDGGDWEETVYSALIDGLDEVSWREDAGKCAILMGDAPALDPEPYTGYTLEMAINKLRFNDTDYVEDYSETVLDSIATQAAEEERSQVHLFTIATYNDDEVVENFTALAEGTGGKSYSVSSDVNVGDIIDEIIEEIPEIIEPVKEELTFFEKIARFFRNIFLILTFRGDEAIWEF